MRGKGGALLLAAVVAAVIVPAAADSPGAAPGTLTGRVVSDLEEAPVAGAQIVVAVPGGNIVATGESAADGKFGIGGIPEGSYVIAVSREGYADWQGSVAMPAADKSMGDIVLHPSLGADGAARASEETSWFGLVIVFVASALAVLFFVARHGQRLARIAGPQVERLPLLPRPLPGKTVPGARRVAAMRREELARRGLL